MDVEQIQNQLSDMRRDLLKMQNQMMDMVEEIEKTQRLLDEEKDDQLAG